MIRKLLQGLFSTQSQTPAGKTDEKAKSELVRKLISEGNQLEDDGELQEALTLYRQAASLAPENAKTHLNIGIVLSAMQDRSGAQRAFQAGLAIDPAHPFLHYNYARLGYLHGALELAEQHLRQALQSKPDFSDASVLLASVHEEQGNANAAIEALKTAAQSQPDHMGIQLNWAGLLRVSRRWQEAEAVVQAMLQRNPQSVEVLRLQSELLRDQGFAQLALEPLRYAIFLAPDAMDLRSTELLLTGMDELIRAKDLFDRHVEFGVRLERMVLPRFLHSKLPGDETRKLRIGYVSGDFCVHPVALFLLPVLEHHARDAFEIFCYASVRKADHITQRMRQLSDHWSDAFDMPDAQLADTIYADGIDVLVDLTGHTSQPRLGVFSACPAPVQVSWLGYLHSTGLTSMDYRLCDARTDPPNHSNVLHTEHLQYLPHSQWCYRPLLDAGSISPAPCETNGYVTFGSFNSAVKITDAMCKRWAKLLAQSPGSRLRIANIDSERKMAAIRVHFEVEGVDSDRLSFTPRVPLDRYFTLYSAVDVALDTYPYGGGTTTFDSLWMGVPVLTAVGETSVTRSAASILSALGLDDWIAPSIDGYVDVALARSSEVEHIVCLRQTLREALKASPLTDAECFVKDLEDAYHKMALRT